MKTVLNAAIVFTVFLGTGCASVSYKVTPSAPTGVRWENRSVMPGKMQVQDTTEHGGAGIKPLAPELVDDALQKKWRDAGANQASYYADCSVSWGKTGEVTGGWTFLPYFLTLGILPASLHDEEGVSMAVSIRDASGRIVAQKKESNLNLKSHGCLSIFLPTGWLLGMATDGDADIKNIGFLSSPAKKAYEEDLPPIFADFLVREINGMTIPQPKQ